MRYIEIGLAVLAAIAVLVSLIPTDFWLIRSIDLVREPFSWAALFLLILGLIFLRGWDRIVVPALLGLVIAINVWKMWPYNPLANTEVALGQPVENERCFTVLSANVKMENRGYVAMRDQIASVDPDVLMLMEPDQAWADELASVLAQYPHVNSQATPDAYGRIFASRVPVLSSVMEQEVYEETPTLYATLQLEGTAPFEFIGLHPKPPIPGENTAERDAAITSAAIETPDQLPDAVVMGDFNDVPWSDTTEIFRERGEWRDPRVGRGTYPTFPNSALWAGWPLDQLMVKGDVRIESWRVMPGNGSDHRAIFAELCLPG